MLSIIGVGYYDYQNSGWWNSPKPRIGVFFFCPVDMGERKRTQKKTEKKEKKKKKKKKQLGASDREPMGRPLAWGLTGNRYAVGSWGYRYVGLAYWGISAAVKMGEGGEGLRHWHSRPRRTRHSKLVNPVQSTWIRHGFSVIERGRSRAYARSSAGFEQVVGLLFRRISDL